MYKKMAFIIQVNIFHNHTLLTTITLNYILIDHRQT